MTDKKKKTDSSMTDQELVEAHASLNREKHPPTVGFLYAPLIFVFVFGCLIFVCSIQLAHTTNNFQLHPPKEVVDLTPEEKEALRIERKVESGKKIFAARCASCHQANGQGIPGQFPPLDGSKWVTSDPGLISKIIIMGLKGEIEVKGVTYGSNPAQNMVAVPINDREIANVVTHASPGLGQRGRGSLRGGCLCLQSRILRTIGAVDGRAAARDVPFGLLHGIAVLSLHPG